MTPEREAQMSRIIDRLDARRSEFRDRQFVADAVGLLDALERLGWRRELDPVHLDQQSVQLVEDLLKLVDALPTLGWRRIR